MPDGPERLAATRAGGPEAAQAAEAARAALRREQIERALSDVALLRSFVSSRNEVSLAHAFENAGFPARPPAETPTREEFLRRLAEIEQMEVDTLARDAGAVAFLFGARDTLNAVAAPADAYTIAFTGFYTGSLPEATQLAARPGFAEMRRQARTSKIVTGAIAAIGVIAVVLAVVISVHAMVGKTVLSQVAATAAALASIDSEIAEYDRQAVQRLEQRTGVRPDIWNAILPPLCERMSAFALLGTNPERFLHGYEGPEHYLVCARRNEAERNLLVAKSELANWIDMTTGVRLEREIVPSPEGPRERITKVHNVTWISWLPGLSVRDVRQHTDYTSPQVGAALLSALAVYYLPVLFGVLGGTVYAVRRLNHKIVASELHPRDWRHALLRIFMAFLLGASIGLFLQPEGTKFNGPTGEVALSIAAISFLAGYSVEVVFRFFDLVITQALRVVGAIAPAGGAPSTPR